MSTEAQISGEGQVTPAEEKAVTEPFQQPVNEHKFAKLLDREIETHETVINNTVNEDDFTLDQEDFDPEEKETKTDPKKETAPSSEVPASTEKSEAFKRLMKPNVILTFADMMLRRADALTPSLPKGYWGLTKLDKADLSVLIQESAEEGNWTGIPAKYLLMAVLSMIIMGKIFGMKEAKKNPQNFNIEQTGRNEEPVNDYDKIRQEIKSKNYSDAKKENEQKQIIDALMEQNKLLKNMIEKLMDQQDNSKEVKFAMHTQSKEGFFKGFDLNRISFSPNGALINPDMAGQKGYTDRGIKTGTPSQADQELRKQYELYHEKMQAA